MAFVQSALLATGTFLAILWFFAQIPRLIGQWRAKDLERFNTRHLLLIHTANLIWMLYAARLWDFDWFLPNVLLSLVSLGHWTLIHLLLRSHTTFLARYVMTVPIVLLTLWRVIPLSLLSLLAALMEVIAQGAYVRYAAAMRTEGVFDTQSLALKTAQSLMWVGFGYIKQDWTIVGAFGLGAAMTSVEFIAQKLVSPARKQR